jgi:hypothetical protein
VAWSGRLSLDPTVHLEDEFVPVAEFIGARAKTGPTHEDLAKRCACASSLPRRIASEPTRLRDAKFSFEER